MRWCHHCCFCFCFCFCWCWCWCCCRCVLVRYLGPSTSRAVGVAGAAVLGDGHVNILRHHRVSYCSCQGRWALETSRPCGPKEIDNPLHPLNVLSPLRIVLPPPLPRALTLFVRLCVCVCVCVCCLSLPTFDALTRLWTDGVSGRIRMLRTCRSGGIATTTR